MSDVKYTEISLPLNAKETAIALLSGAAPRKIRRMRVLNPAIKEWKICEVCGRSFYRVEGSKRKLCGRQDCAPDVLRVRLPGCRQPGRGRD